MESSGGRRKGKRIHNDDEDDYNPTLASTQVESPAFVRGMQVLEILKMNQNLNFCPYMKELANRIIAHEERHPTNSEALLAIIFNEDLLWRILRTNNPGTLAGPSVLVRPPPWTSSPPRILESGGQKLQLYFETKMPTFLYSGDNVKEEGGSEIRVVLKDLNNGSVVQTGPFSAAKLNIVLLQGDFNEEINDGWEREFFKRRQVKERDGKRPILIGDLRVKLEGGVGILGDFSFTDNSSWTRSKKFRLGVELASGLVEGIRIMEGKTNAFKVKDRRGKSYEKHDVPALSDKVWRLYGIAKDGKLHKCLASAKIDTVEELLCLHAMDPQRLKDILGKETETIIQHAKRSVNHIHEPRGFITNRPAVPWDSLDQTQKISHLAQKAYENMHQVLECDDQSLGSFTTSKEMQDCPDAQAYSRNYNITLPQTGHTFHSVQKIQPNCTSAPSVPQQSLEPPFSSVVPEKCSLQNNGTVFYGEKNSSGVNEAPEIDDFNIDVGIGRDKVLDALFCDSNKVYYSPNMDRLFDGLFEAVPHFDGLFEADTHWPLEAEPVYSAAKAVIGWLKIKVVLKWGIVVRNSAARKRAKLTELLN